MKQRMKEWLRVKRTVQQAWRQRLPEPHDRLFDATVAELEAAYAMLSVALNEAFALRSRGRLNGAQEAAGVAAELLERLSEGLLGSLAALAGHAKHFGALPDVAPLDPEFFRGEPAKRAAAWNRVLQNVLFGARSRFFHKIHTLDDLSRGLADEFQKAAGEIAEGASTSPARDWAALETIHDDLNTCLRETIVVFKTFLNDLSPEEVRAFEQRLQSRTKAPRPSRRRERAKSPRSTS